MDDRRFDQLVKAVASGASRRSVLKGMLGLGATALAGSVALDTDVDAARRPTPTPKPVKCPGKQTWDGNECVCDVPPAPGPHKCGSDCCTGLPGDDPAPGHSECCDNACCFGTCYGEELCCPTNPGPGEQPPTHQVCDGPNGASCCTSEQACCLLDGCCDTVCYGGMVGADSCCDAANFCPGGGQSPDLCCTDGTECCGGGTDDNSCVDLSIDGACCTVDDCSSPGEGDCGCACSNGLCISVTCTEGETCCDGECFSDLEVVACPGGLDGCCDRETQICCGGTDCCAEDQCTSEGECCTGDDLACNTVCCPYGQCAAGVECCTGDDVVCVDACCPAERCVDGQGCCEEGDIACGGICCPADVFFCNEQEQCECLAGTEPCSELPGGCCPTGQCNEAFVCCPAGTSPCGEVCCDDLTQTCSDQGICECTGDAIPCDGGCVVAQCCGNDTTNCAEQGYDPVCVLCVNGACTDAGTEFTPCTTADVADGWCNNGHCIACSPDGSGCDEPTQCCSNNCVVGTCQTG